MDSLPLLLVLLMGAPRQVVRQEAHDALRGMGSRAELALRAGRTSNDMEVRWRSDNLLSLLPARTVADWFERHGPAPWIDALPDDHPDREDIIFHYHKLANSKLLTNVVPNFDLDAEAGRLYITDLLSQGKWEEAEATVMGMHMKIASDWDGFAWRVKDQ